MIIKNLGRNFFINLFLVLLIFLLDRISKIYVINLDKNLIGSEIYSSKYLNINLIWNEGIAFGLLSFDQEILYNSLTILIILIICFIFLMILKSSGLSKFALLMIFGGALGNVFDRILYKAVPDFIDFHVGNFHWFIFNVSDIFITLGVIWMVILELIDNSKIEARSAFRDYEGAKITLRAVEAEVEASRLVVDGVAKELNFGLKTTLDLLDAEKGFNDAELRLVQARHDIILKEFKLIAATGGLTANKLGIGHILDKLSDSPRPENPLGNPLNFW